MSFDFGGLLQQFAGGTAPDEAAQEHYQTVVQNAPADLLTRGLAAMFHSDQTPPFAQMAAQLFDRSNPSQQAGMLNQLLATMGPTVLASLGGSAGSALSTLLGGLTQTAGGPPTVTPEQASQLTAEQVQQIASHAEQHAPGIVESMSGFYAQHSDLIKSLGSAALAIAMAKMAESHRS